MEHLVLSQSFAALGLADALCRAVIDAGYTDPTPVQLQAIPVILAGRDVLAGAQTGTGKTAGFTLPLLQRLFQANKRPAPKTARALILTPTRELAAQVEESVRMYGKHLPLKSTLVFGGVGMQPQVNALGRGVDVLVATPGRLLDHVNCRTVDLSKVEILVLDEADRMLDMGFIRDIRRVLALLPKERQNLLFSATFSDEIRDLAGGLLRNPASVQVARRNQEAELISQRAYLVAKELRRDLLVHLVKEGNWYQALVFTKTKHGANRLAEQLQRAGLEADAIHGNKSQNARNRALSDFKSAKMQVLVATDIAARGLDIELLPHVVNFDLPNVPEDYVHRIGRTGRAGATGEAISLVCKDDEPQLAAIERLLKKRIERMPLPEFTRLAPPPRDEREDEAGSEQRAPRGRGAPAKSGHLNGQRHGRAQPKGPSPARGGAARPGQPRPQAASQSRPGHPWQEQPSGQPRPAQSRPGRPAQGRPSDGRPNPGRPNQGRPNQSRPNQGQGRPDASRGAQSRRAEGRQTQSASMPAHQVLAHDEQASVALGEAATKKRGPMAALLGAMGLGKV